MIRLVCGAIAGLLCVCQLTACTGSDQKQTGGGVRSSVTLLHYFTGSLSGGLNDMAKVFNGSNTSYDLKPIPLDHESFKTSIRQSITSGNPPELYSYWAGARTASLVEHLEPLDDIWQRHGLDQRFTPALTKAACEYQGKKYFIPLTQHFVGFFYNKQVFQASGIQPPNNWAEFLRVCEQLKARGIIPVALGAREKWPAQFWFDMLLLRTAGYDFRQQLMQGTASYRDQRVTTVFEYWRQLIRKGYFKPSPNSISWDSGANELVYSGKAAMTLMGTWEIGYFSDARHHWTPGKEFDFFPFPMIDGKQPRIAMGPIDGLILPRQAANKAGAKEVMAFLTNAEPQKALSRGSGALAPSRTIPASFYSDIQLRIRREIEQSPQFAFNYDLSTPPAVAELGLNAFSEFLEFPDDYQTIQKKLANAAARQFSKQSGF